MKQMSKTVGMYKSVLETIGHTPIIQMHRTVPKGPHEFHAKVEYFNPGGSVKDRIALAIIEDAERSGKLKPGGTIVEATSGNTGVGLALVAAIKGYKCIFVMPEKISEEKRAVLRAYGARVVITPAGVEADDPRSHYSVAAKFTELVPGAYCTNQYHNPVNAEQHYRTTGPEIWEQTGGHFDIFVAGAGTGGTISGVGRYLKEKNPNIKILCADPFGSILKDMFYHKKILTPAGSYLVEGIGEDMLPDNVHFGVMDDFEQVDDKESFAACRAIARQEGLLVGTSSGAAFAGAVKYAAKQTTPQKFLIMFPDSGRAYLSKAFNEQWMFEKGLLESPLTKIRVGEFVEKMKASQPEAALKAGSTLKEAVRLMRDQSKQQLPVFDSGKFMGVVDIRDIVTMLSEGRLKPDEMIMHVLKSNVPEISKDATLDQLQGKLRKDLFVRVAGSGEMISETEFGTYLAENFGE